MHPIKEREPPKLGEKKIEINYTVNGIYCRKKYAEFNAKSVSKIPESEGDVSFQSLQSLPTAHVEHTA